MRRWLQLKLQVLDDGEAELPRPPARQPPSRGDVHILAAGMTDLLQRGPHRAPYGGASTTPSSGSTGCAHPTPLTLIMGRAMDGIRPGTAQTPAAVTRTPTTAPTTASHHYAQTLRSRRAHGRRDSRQAPGQHVATLQACRAFGGVAGRTAGRRNRRPGAGRNTAGRRRTRPGEVTHHRSTGKSRFRTPQGLGGGSPSYTRPRC